MPHFQKMYVCAITCCSTITIFSVTMPVDSVDKFEHLYLVILLIPEANIAVFSLFSHSSPLSLNFFFKSFVNLWNRFIFFVKTDDIIFN